MGPTPGIMLGAVLGCLGLVLRNAFLQKFSLLLLIINGFNLIPFVPLDGGWALQTIIFSRHYYFDVVFKIVAALAMLGLSILLKTRSLMYVGIVTLTSLPIAMCVAKATAKLRKQSFLAASPDDQNIPDAVAETIIAELKATMPKAGTRAVRSIFRRRCAARVGTSRAVPATRRRSATASPGGVNAKTNLEAETSDHRQVPR